MASQLTPGSQHSPGPQSSPGTFLTPGALLPPGSQLTPGSQSSSSAEPTPAATKPAADQEADQSFFRPWVLRSGRRNASGGSSSASAASPGTMPTKRPDLNREHRRKHSQSPLAHRRPPSTSAFTTAVAFIDETISRKSKDYNETLHTRPSFPSRKSSPSIHTRRSFQPQKRRSSIGSGPQDAYSADAAEGARSKISHLFITKKGKKNLRLGSPRKVFSEPASSQTSTRSSRYTRGHQVSDASDATASTATITATAATTTPATNPLLNKKFRALNPDAIPPEGLYCRLRRQLGLKKGPLPSSPTFAPSSCSTTGFMLDQTTSLLRALLDEKNPKSLPPSKKPSISVSTSTSNLSIAAAKGRHGGLFQRGTHTSASSSLRNIFIGKPHVVTPDPEAFYTAADNEQYFRTEITSPGGPNFLPSEAHRVGTPPLPDSDSSGKGGRRHRGFFFDYRPPEPDDTERASPSKAKSPGWEPFTPRPRKPSPSSSSRPSPSHHLSSNPSSGSAEEGDDDHERDIWFRVRVEGPERNGTVARFEFDLPDHLPSSPLCPRHPKHGSGGRGICVYHGRLTTGEVVGSC